MRVKDWVGPAVDADGSHEQTDHHVVVYSGSGDGARDFIVGERVYDTETNTDRG